MANNNRAHADHITPIKVYILVGLTLLILTALTVKVSTVHLGPWNAIAALAIACTKALLVALFFMHLLYERRMYAVVVASALIFLGIFIGLTMADVLRRGDIYENQGQPINAEAKFYSKLRGDTTAVKSDTAVIDTASPSGEK
jgi:cytochrome c oxidase subunit 4